VAPACVIEIGVFQDAKSVLMASTLN